MTEKDFLERRDVYQLITGKTATAAWLHPVDRQELLASLRPSERAFTPDGSFVFHGLSIHVDHLIPEGFVIFQLHSS